MNKNNGKYVAAYGKRPLVGVINYEGTHGFGRLPDENSLTPPKWNYRLPFYASLENYESRLVRTSNTQQEIVYYKDANIVSIIIYAAFEDNEALDAVKDIKIYSSKDGRSFTQYNYGTSDVRIIKYATNWQKVAYQAMFPLRTKYIKIAICKTDGSTINPQIMRVEAYYVNWLGKMLKITDDLNDFSKMQTHTNNLGFASNDKNNFALVLADDSTQEIMDRQIEYANNAHIDYFAWDDTPLSNVVNLFRSSTKKSGIGYCVIVNMASEGTNETWNKRADRYVSYFKDSFYVKVLNRRPLIYLFDPSIWSKADMDILRRKSIAASCGNPYIVGMSFGGGDYSAFCDAGSRYLATDAGVYEQYVGTTHTVPLVNFGANEGPRVNNPVPWGNGSQNASEIIGASLKQYVNQGIRWCYDNPNANYSNTILINSWNEHCESAACLDLP